MISSETIKIIHSGTGSVDTFSFPFLVHAASHLRVVVADSAGTEYLKTLDSHYTVAASSIGNSSGGEIVFTAGNIPAAGETVLIKLDGPYTQDSQLNPNTQLPAKTIETAMDRLAQMVLQILEKTGRAVLAAETSDLAGLTYPAAVAGRAIKWNPAGDGLINSTYDPDAAGDTEAARDAAQAAQAAAEDARDAAQAAQNALDLPTITAADEGKGLLVDASGNWIKSATVATLGDITDKIVDEDDMASNSAALVPTQQSTKKYVDDRFCHGYIRGFGHKRLGNTTITLFGGDIEFESGVYSMGSNVTITHAYSTTTWIHIYCNPANGPATGLSDSDFSLSGTGPVRSNTMHGWWNSALTARWVGMFHITAGVIDWYTCLGGVFTFNIPMLINDSASAPTTWTEIATGLPNLGVPWIVDVKGIITATTAGRELRVRSADCGNTTDDMSVACCDVVSEPGHGKTTVITDSAGNIDWAVTNTAAARLALQSFVMPDSCGGR